MFSFFGLLIIILGALMMFGCTIWFTIETFSESVWWGLACLLIPFAAFAFLFIHWDRAGKPFLYSFASFAVLMFGQVLCAI